MYFDFQLYEFNRKKLEDEFKNISKTGFKDYFNQARPIKEIKKSSSTNLIFINKFCLLDKIYDFTNKKRLNYEIKITEQILYLEFDLLALNNKSSATIIDFSHCEEMIRITKPTLVDLIVPPKDQLKLIRKIAKFGINIICQKPLTNSIKDAK